MGFRFESWGYRFSLGFTVQGSELRLAHIHFWGLHLNIYTFTFGDYMCTSRYIHAEDRLCFVGQMLWDSRLGHRISYGSTRTSPRIQGQFRAFYLLVLEEIREYNPYIFPILPVIFQNCLHRTNKSRVSSAWGWG